MLLRDYEAFVLHSFLYRQRKEKEGALYLEKERALSVRSSVDCLFKLKQSCLKLLNLCHVFVCLCLSHF